MDKKILEILINNYPNFASNGRVAKEITAHITEFIEWVGRKGIERFSDDEIESWTLYKYNSMEVDKEFHSIDEMYQHWLTKEI